MRNHVITLLSMDEKPSYSNVRNWKKEGREVMMDEKSCN
jgi:hypothetical protein